MKSILRIAAYLSVASLAVAQSDGQQTISDTYSLSCLGYSGWVGITLPGEAFTSVRLLGIGGGFKGVIADSCTDYMTNPAENFIGSLRLYANIGRESGVETVYLGTFVGNRDQGLSVLLKVRNLSFSSDAFTSTWSGGTYENSQNSDVGRRRGFAGADLRYNHSLPSGTMIGAGYQFRYTGSSSSFSDARSNMSFPDSGFSLQGQETDFSNSGPENRFMLGGSFPNRNGSLQVYGYATATAHHPNETESFRFANSVLYGFRYANSVVPDGSQGKIGVRWHGI